MLTGKLVRVRFARQRLLPRYLDTQDPAWREVAERLLELFRGHEGWTRGELQAEITESIGSDPGQLVHQGLAKLLEDRCEFEVVSGQPPEQLREAVFRAAAAHRLTPPSTEGVRPAFNRAEVLHQVAGGLDLTVEALAQGLFADLKSEQRLVHFKDISADHLLERYNVALAQAVLLRAVGVQVDIQGEPPQRYRQLFRLLKFHRLVCEIVPTENDGYRLQLDGPLSLFSATQKYGLQLALFLPALLRCRQFELTAEVRWGPQRKPTTFTLSAADGLAAHTPDSGMYVPAELGMFVELFRKRIADWEITEEAEILPLGESYWVPDFRLRHLQTGREVLLEVLGFWRRSGAERHLERLRRHADQPFLLAVSDQLRVDDADLESLPAGIHRFRQMPLPDEIARLAGELIQQS